MDKSPRHPPVVLAGAVLAGIGLWMLISAMAFGWGQLVGVAGIASLASVVSSAIGIRKSREARVRWVAVPSLIVSVAIIGFLIYIAYLISQMHLGDIFGSGPS